MTNREAIEYASKHSFLELFNLGKAAGIEELVNKCIEQDIDDIPFPSRLMQNIADQIVGEENENKRNHK